MPGKRTVVKRTAEEEASASKGRLHAIRKAADRIAAGRSVHEVAAELGWQPRGLALAVAPELVRRGVLTAGEVASAIRQGRTEEQLRKMGYA